MRLLLNVVVAAITYPQRVSVVCKRFDHREYETKYSCEKKLVTHVLSCISDCVQLFVSCIAVLLPISFLVFEVTAVLVHSPGLAFNMATPISNL